jgi:hypothetical protein
MLEFVGEQFVDLIPHFDGTEKEISTRDQFGKVKMVHVNRKTQRAANGDMEFGPDDVNLKDGRHVATISTGPSFDNEREMARELAMSLLGNPQMAPIAAPHAIRLMNVGPEGDAMADELEAMQPPPIQALRAQREGKLDPKQLLQENMKLKQQMQEAHQVIGVAQQHIKSKQDELQNKLDIAQWKGGVDLHLAEMANEVKLAVAELTAKQKNMELFMQESQLVGARSHEAAMAAADAGHEAHMASVEHANTLTQMQQPSPEAAPAAPEAPPS